MPDPAIPPPSAADLARDLTADYTSMQRPLHWNEIDLDAWDDAREGWPSAIRRAVAAERRAEALREALGKLGGTAREVRAENTPEFMAWLKQRTDEAEAVYDATNPARGTPDA